MVLTRDSTPVIGYLPTMCTAYGLRHTTCTQYTVSIEKMMQQRLTFDIPVWSRPIPRSIPSTGSLCAVQGSWVLELEEV